MKEQKLRICGQDTKYGCKKEFMAHRMSGGLFGIYCQKCIAKKVWIGNKEFPR